MKTVNTFMATIWVGLKEHYTDEIHSIDEVKEICQKYCDEIGLCVSVTPTTFIYTDGNEDGASIGLINYPRFPATKEEIIDKALKLAEELRYQFNQFKVSVVCPDKTYMVEESM
jgi:hypothetical protein